MVADNYIKNWHEVVQHVLQEYPNEACGIIDSDNIFHPYPNIHSDPLHCFELSSTVFIEHDLKAILHSHTYDQKTSHSASRDLARCPSFVDQESQISSDVEWCVVVCDGEGVDQPIWWGDYNHTAPLMDREFIPGAQDCLTFIADWMYQNKGIELPRQPHSEDWFQNGEDFMSELYKTWGFSDINSSEIEIGDLVMFKIRSSVVNHLGIYVGNSMVAHHLFNRLPVEELLCKWEGYIERIARYAKND
ncbi:NlpC/P60 family protein [Sapientia aquatica]|jgi:proteasome lid subunit RPN8/RPN11|uniref:NlpC/P60 domain-containing protein n=1 Tax=Sapientia aquatica TaxID=1549640 RepID=A0A4R5VWV3_9BURK|nr:NlpC/P60 family protein [Sapientia aquatica]TDK63557.1 hypothetical protein E2I14_15260 [Sapientia aquatica]